jgi:opacity protein-like surface antigen
LGLSTGLSDSPSYSFAIEYGKIFRHLEGGLKFSYYNTFPLSNENRSVGFIDRGNGQNVFFTDAKYYSGKKYLSLTLNIGYNILSLFSDKHNFTPFVAFGCGSLTKLDNTFADNTVSLDYDYKIAFEYGFGARYEYALNDKVRLGAYYKYYNFLERNILGVNISRIF